MKPTHYTRNTSLSVSLFVFLIGVLSVQVAAASSSPSSPPRDPTHQLLSFKATLPNPSLLSNWLPNTNPCSFTGITCTTTAGAGASVTSIDLSSVPLTTNLTAVATFLLPLDHLQVLSLKSANLTGPIPSPSNSCSSSLTTIDLSQNAISGSLSDMSFLCRSLQHLDLSSNNFSVAIPSLGDCSSLQHLDLSANKYFGDITRVVSSCTELVYLNVSGNHFTGQIPVAMGDGLCSTLVELDLSSNNLTGPVPDEFTLCSSLISLDISSNRFTGELPIEIFVKMEGLRELSVGFNQFEGLLPESLTEMVSLESLDLSSNNFYGTIPKWLCQDPRNRLKELFLQNNHFTGSIPSTLSNCSNLVGLDLSFNYLNGSIPSTLGSLSNLRDLIIWLNQLTGEIPQELGNIKTLQNLILDFNELTGSIPAGLSNCTQLNWISLSNNRLTGEIPSWIGKLSNLAILKISHNMLSGTIPKEIGVMYYLYILNLGHNNISGSIPQELGSMKNLNILDLSHNRLQGSIPQSLTSLSLLTEIDFSNNFLAGLIPESGQFDTFPATRFQNNSDSLIGSGGFGDVYKAQLKDGSLVAIKKLIHVSGQGDREFTAEMETIGKIKHRNLVPLLGYCKVGEERLLVYDYMKYGSLEDVLHDQKKAGIKLNWAVRRKIAIGAARGLAFLHHNCIPHIIHRDMKSSNVLLDENLEARVSDFGMARLMSAMDTHLSVSTLAGTPGYVPPEYYQSFRCSTKGDVYSYGVVLLELLTGKRPTDSADFGDNNLVGWVKQHAKLKISDVFDPELMKEEPSLEIELLQHLKVACACLDDRPWRRPTMIQVMAMFKEIQAGSGVDSQSTIVTDDESFSTIEMVEMSIKEAP
ncbi:hypothetical protein Ahy_B10g104261 isoform A [Arachis hypogaea]|uniref:non-specific serine/threonine protein kinase n=1 Tax=Arachis hypogaea TaxID=3818 RepID=A0A444X528_ARAHY|nr:hypothetical protein Ahy_B10g104261 isoform A [Arachis hypogaea]